MTSNSAERRTLLMCIALTVLLSVPLLLRIPRLLPLTDLSVASKAPGALQQLRTQGMWAVHADIRKIEKRDGKVCYDWNHQYRSRYLTGPKEVLTTCIDE